MMRLLSIEEILFLHEEVINPHELQWLADDKSLEGMLHRVESRLHYGMVGDTYDLAAIYAVIIAVGHVFNDANKRTAFMAMDTCLRRNDVVLEYDMETMGHMIVEVVQGLVDETELARYLRTVPTKEG